jgi:hypothetical protein
VLLPCFVLLPSSHLGPEAEGRLEVDAVAVLPRTAAAARFAAALHMSWLLTELNFRHKKNQTHGCKKVSQRPLSPVPPSHAKEYTARTARSPPRWGVSDPPAKGDACVCVVRAVLCGSGRPAVQKKSVSRKCQAVSSTHVRKRATLSNPLLSRAEDFVFSQSLLKSLCTVSAAIK